MATNRNQHNAARINSGVRDRSLNEYAMAYGNTVRKVQPQYAEPRRAVPKRDPRQDVRTRRNAKPKVAKRPRVLADQGIMTKQYVMFLCITSIVILFSCAAYIGGRADLTARANEVSRLQKEVSDMKIENDAKYGIIGQKVNLEDVRERAYEMGMQFLDSEQVIKYESPVEDIMKQYENIPSSGVLPQSEKTFE